MNYLEMAIRCTVIVSELLDEVVEKIEDYIDQYNNIQKNEIDNGWNLLEANSYFTYGQMNFSLLSEYGTHSPLILMLLQLLSKLNNIVTEEVDADYSYKKISSDLFQNCYYQDQSCGNVCIPHMNDNYLFVITLDELNEINFNETQVLHLLKVLNNKYTEVSNDSPSTFIFLPISSLLEDIEEKNLVALFKLVMSINNEPFHKHHNQIQRVPLIDSIKQECLNELENKKFVQFEEILYILSEFNYSNDILNKYFLLYTVIENFMYRSVIANMVNNPTPKFSIRDFKRLSNNISDTEPQAIKKFFKSLYQIQITTSLNISEYITSVLDKFRTDHIGSISDISQVLLQMGLPHINGHEYKNFDVVIYQFRNSIIHNKETEFHITHLALAQNPVIVLFLEKVLIPILENIIYFLITHNNNCITYAESSIPLYET